MREAVPRLVADEEVEPAVAVVIGPRAGLGRVLGIESGFARDVGEDAAIVAQQRVGEGLDEPAAAEDEDVRVAVVVVVGVDEVEPAQEALEPRLGRPVDEAARAIALEVAEGVQQAAGRRHHVRQAVAVEVIDDGAPGERDRVQTHPRGHVLEAGERSGPAHGGSLEPVLGRDAAGPRAGGHRGEVQHPAGPQVVGTQLQERPVPPDRRVECRARRIRDRA